MPEWLAWILLPIASVMAILIVAAILMDDDFI